VQHDEDVVVVLIELRALVAREDVLVIEGVEIEVLLKPVPIGRARRLDVDPADAGSLDDLRLGHGLGQHHVRRPIWTAARAGERARQGKVRHGGMVRHRLR
jgi:hypothetical protein